MAEDVTTLAIKAKDVTTLAIKAKDDPAYMAPLWDAVHRLINAWARSSGHGRAIRETGTAMFDIDDLMQAGYLALVDAVAGYDSENEAGAGFITYLGLRVKNRFAEVAGRRGTKKRPEHYSTSIDAPLSGFEDLTLGDTIPDPNSDFEAEITQREGLRQDCADLMVEVEKLPEEQRQALMLTSWDGLPATVAAKIMDIPPRQVLKNREKAAIKVRNTKTGRRIAQERYCIKSVSLGQFKHTFTSEVEKHILWLEAQGILYD